MDQNNNQAAKVTGPVMLCATDILKRPELRIGHLYGNVSLPRPVRVAVLVAVGAGAGVGVLIGILLGGFKGAIYGGIFLGALGGGAVSYSPLKGESLFTWLGLTMRNRRKEVAIDGRAVRLAVGIYSLEAPVRGKAHLHPGAVHIDPDQWDDRGVLRSERNGNLDTPSFSTEAISPMGVEPIRGSRRTKSSRWGRSAADEGIVVYPTPEQAEMAAILDQREIRVKRVIFGEDPPQLISPEDRLATKVALARNLGLRVDQIILGDCGLPGTVIPLPPTSDGRPQLVQASTYAQTAELARDVVSYASGVTAAWLARRMTESEEAWARRIFHFKVEVGALDPETAREADWLKVAGIDIDTGDGADELHKALEDKPGRFDSVTVELSANQMAFIDSGVQVLNARDALIREQLRSDAAAMRDQMLADADERADAASRTFVAALRRLRVLSTKLLNALAGGDGGLPAGIRAELSVTADELRIGREEVLVAAEELSGAYRVVEAVEVEDYGALDAIGQEAAGAVDRLTERANRDELRQQQTLAPLFRDNFGPGQLEQLSSELEAFFVEQTQFAATTVAQAKAIRDKVLVHIDHLQHQQGASAARTSRAGGPLRISDIVGQGRTSPFPPTASDRS